MATFVHLAFETDLKSISKNGISLSKDRKCVYAMPVSPNFFVSHQWLRELKRRKNISIIGVYFRIADDERVFAGRYNGEHEEMSAAQASGLVTNDDLGFEVLIQRRIESHEVHRIKRLPQGVGWRYYPESHGKKPCGCPYCQRGEYGGKRIKQKYEESEV
jgi:hypothetical protein